MIRRAHPRWLGVFLLILPLQLSAAETTSLGGAWKFRPGDDPAWADPHLDDRAWTSRALLDVWRSPGFPDSGQMAWYRLRIGPEELADLETPAIRLGFVRNAYEIYVNGRYVGGAGALPPDPVVTHDRIQILPLTGPGASAQAEMVIALRVWGGNDLSVRQTGGGPYADEFLLGNYSSLLEQLYLSQAPLVIFSAAFLLWGTYFLYLYLRTAVIKPFLWFGVTTIVLATYLLTQSQLKYALDLPFPMLEKFESSVFFIFLALLIQLIWSVLGRPPSRVLRTFQGYFLLLAALLLVVPGLDVHYHLRPYGHFGAVLALAPVAWVIISAARSGNRDARILLVGLAIFVATAINDLLVTHQFIDGIGLMSVGFLAIAGSMAVILADKFSYLVHDLETEVTQRTAELEGVNLLLAAANRNLEEMSRVDPLTGLLNRRAFETEAESERQRMLRHRTPLALLVTDIDCFKSFNDRFGHQCGDLVLKEVAALIDRETRDIDHVSRWGGEEFLLLLPNTELADAAHLADRIRTSIEQYTFDFGGQALGVTLTFGATVFRDGEVLEECISRADAALYRGKRHGRNRVETCPPAPQATTAGHRL